MNTISWWDAWALWFSGHEVPGGTYMGPFTILAWGRIGKIVAFFGGATVILDLLGPVRLRSIGRKQRRRMESRYRTIVLANLLLALVVYGLSVAAIASIVGAMNLFPTKSPAYYAIYIVGIIASVVLLAVMVRFGMEKTFSAPILIARILETDTPAQAIRYVAASLLVVGFHLDLLAS